MTRRPLPAALERLRHRLPPDQSLAQLVAGLSPGKRRQLLNGLTGEELDALQWDWRFWLRPKQWPPEGDWYIWLALAGRGWGKNRTGAHWIHDRAMAGDETRWMALVARTPKESRDVMLTGPGGILKVTPPDERPHYEPSKLRLTWPTGAYATIYSGENPEALRGFSGDTAWLDELAAYQYPQETWDNLQFGLREAKVERPRVFVSTTPKRIPLVRELLARERIALVRGSSYENRANLAPEYYREVIEPYEGTTLGRQEIYAEILDEAPGALWTRVVLERTRVKAPPERLSRVAIAVDPAVTAGPRSAETGIMGGGLSEREGYLLHDASGRYSPQRWATRVVELYEELHADAVVAEANQGGEMVERVLRTVPGGEHLPVILVHATRGKQTRAQPVASLYERGKIHHVGFFAELEDQYTTWVPDEDAVSPDRLDAAVWLWTYLMLGHGHATTARLPVMRREG